MTGLIVALAYALGAGCDRALGLGIRSSWDRSGGDPLVTRLSAEPSQGTVQ